MAQTFLTSRSGIPLKKRFSESFRKRADEAAFWEAYVGAVLCRNGLFVCHMPMHLGEFHNEKASTVSDLVVETEDPNSPRTPVEVKSRSIKFTDPETYPYETVRVCSKKWYDKNWPGYDRFGRDFILVSTATAGMVWVPAGTPCIFGTVIKDRERNETFEVVQCRKDDLRSMDEFIGSLLPDSKR